jgi:aerobic C4-dicarboxylate transport protein
MCRAVVNMIGNAVATLVVARWENELDRDSLQRNLAAQETGSRSVQYSPALKEVK